MANPLMSQVDIQFDFLSFGVVCVEDEHSPLSSPLCDFPFFLDEAPEWVNRTCIPRSTIYPTDTKSLVIVGTCRKFISIPFGRHGSRGRDWHARWDVRCRFQFRRPPIVLAFRDVSTILHGSSCDWTHRNPHTTPHLDSRCSPSSSLLCISSQRQGPFRLLLCLRRSAIIG